MPGSSARTSVPLASAFSGKSRAQNRRTAEEADPRSAFLTCSRPRKPFRSLETRYTALDLIALVKEGEEAALGGFPGGSAGPGNGPRFSCARLQSLAWRYAPDHSARTANARAASAASSIQRSGEFGPRLPRPVILTVFGVIKR